jgi:hypothetical protein
MQQKRRERLQPADAAIALEPVEDPNLQTAQPRAVTPGAQDQSANQPTMVGGTVRESDGTPVAHAFVTMLAPGGRQLLRTFTDVDGHYAVTALPKDFVIVVLLARDHAPAVTRVLPSQGRRLQQDFVLAADVSTPESANFLTPPPDGKGSVKTSP